MRRALTAAAWTLLFTGGLAVEWVLWGILGVICWPIGFAFLVWFSRRKPPVRNLEDALDALDDLAVSLVRGKAK